jgi:plasmid stabilization system protein ParE
MVFRVEISPEALANLDAIARHILERGSFESAERLHVRHWAMKPAEADELGDLMDEANEAGKPT